MANNVTGPPIISPTTGVPVVIASGELSRGAASTGSRYSV
jgi:hypothetical protein